jgi:peptidoglycan/LPS O-acetylase OafA/YrhL
LKRQFPALSGLAILLVVLNHAIALSLGAAKQYGQPPPTGWERVLLTGLKSLGLVAVPAFLFFSGAFMVYALQGRPLALAYRTVILGLRHIVVPYVIWSVVFYLVVFLLQGERYTILEYAKSLAVGFPYYFIPLLVFFYLLAPLLVRAAARHPWLVVLVCVAYQLFSLAVLRPDLGFALPDVAYRLTLPVLRYSIAIYGLFFPVGVVCALHSERVTAFLERVRWPLAGLAAAAYGLAVGTELGLVHLPHAALAFPVFMMGLFLVIRRESLPMGTELEWMGRRALGLYLTSLIFPTLALAAVGASAPVLFNQMLVLVSIVTAFTILALRFLVLAVEQLPLPAARRYVLG